MKNKKWLNYTLGILLTLIVLTAVAGAGFRAGMMQNTTFTRFARGAYPPFAHGNLGRLPQQAQDDFRDDKLQGMQGNLQRQSPRDVRGLDFRGDGFRFPIFGLIQLAVLGLVVWVGYKLIKKSGWRLSLSKTTSTSSPAAPVAETPAADDEEKKVSE
ncbi:hypothetical protein ANAEL_01402 [Anaerolineales bacterium]|nr:hypothetical protein ANAEL_01402 [Anaerolineales bacterium]